MNTKVCNIVFTDFDSMRLNLLPISFTRPMAAIRVGILTIAQKWEKWLPSATVSYLTIDYMQEKFPYTEAPLSLFIAGNMMPTAQLIEALGAMEVGEAATIKGELVAFYGTKEQFDHRDFNHTTVWEFTPSVITYLYDIFNLNGEAIAADFALITAGRNTQPLSSTNQVIGDITHLFIEEGAQVECTTFNLQNGYVYIGKEVEIMEGSNIRAPFAACDHVKVKMGTRIYGATTLGPYCKVGGELSNVVMIGYSNKGHDGFLGNAVIGEWCNIGAGTNASNLKNDYTQIKLWNYKAHRFLPTGLQFCGLIMGDHSKAGINSMFNTATVIGVGVSIYGAGFPRNFVPSFSEGGNSGFTDVSLPKFYAIAEKMMSRRNIMLSLSDKKMFEAIFTQAENYK